MSALEPGSTLGSYRILARLRAGAMGVLYLARRHGTTGFSRPVAIKVIHDHLALDKRFVRMFVDEAKVSAFIDDPNVVRVEEFGQAGGRYYLVMEYVDGASLAQVLGVLKRKGKIPVEQAVAIAMQIAGGLHGAHEATDEAGKPLGIVHRDVSPHNVLVSFKGYVRVIDFGIAKARQVGGQTKTGSLRGKIAYMPPEQARSARTVDRRADLYGVGLVLWEMLTLRRVFDADTDIAILNQIRDPQIAPPSTINPAVPRALDEVVMRTLSQDPAERPATGTALQRALAEAVPGALMVLPGDLAALMARVRAAAEALAGGEDDAAQYGDELKESTGTFAGSLHDSVEQANASLGTRPSKPDEDPPRSSPPPSHVPAPPPSHLPAPPPALARASSPPSGPIGPPPAPVPQPLIPRANVPTAPTEPNAPPPRSVIPTPPPAPVVIGRGPIVEDETTMRRDAPVRGGALLRPADGVRALAQSTTGPHTPPSSPSLQHALRGSSPNLPPLQPSQPPVSSVRGSSANLPAAMAPHPSSPSLAPAMAPRASSPNLAPLAPNAPGLLPTQTAPAVATDATPGASSLSQKQKMALAVGVPVSTGLIIALAVILAGAGETAPPPVRVIPHDAAASAPPETRLVAPVVIAPPAAPDEHLDAGADAAPTSRPPPRPRSSAGR